MGRRNHIAKLTGKIYNKLPKKVKPLARKGIRAAPNVSARGKAELAKRRKELLWGKKR